MPANKYITTDFGYITYYTGSVTGEKMSCLIATEGVYPENAIDLRYTLTNGNYIRVRSTAQGTDIQIEFYNSEGTLIARANPQGGNIGKRFAALYSNNDEEFYCFEGSYTSQNEITIYQPGPFPAAFASCDYFTNLVSYRIQNLNNTFFEGSIVVKPDPYGDFETSEPGGGEGDHDTSTDPVPVPTLPSVSAVDTGFITLFNPSLAQIKALATYMWSTGFDLDTFKKLFADPMDAIMGLSIVPVVIPAGGTRPVTVGNISTGVNMTVAGQQYIEKDCGSIDTAEFWGAYLDYAPYTKVEIYLPFIGTKTLDIDDVMNKTLQVKYHIDILSGACVAFLQSEDHVVYSFTGQCAAQVPVTSADMNNLISGAIGAAAAIGGALVTGGAAIPVVAAAASTARAVVSAKPNIDRSGDMSGYSGLLGIQKPYLIISRPLQCVPAMQNTFLGYPTFITRTLGSLSGYTEIENMHLSIPGASGPEMDEALQLLKEGVIL